MKNFLKYLLLTVLSVAVLIQLVPVSRTNPPESGPLVAPAEVKEILTNSCYDCHSNKTKWPWYSRVAPVSWWVVDHVNEGREELNFSNWGALDPEEQGEMLEEIVEEVEEKKMPLPSYTLGHPQAALSTQEVKVLRNWVQATRGALPYDGGEHDDSEFSFQEVQGSARRS